MEPYFCWLGFQPNPENIIHKSDAVIRPGRDGNPWGRDVIEAITYGKPIISQGTSEIFVTQGVNGFLTPDFEAGQVADFIRQLESNPELREKIRRSNLDKAQEIFNPAKIIRKLMTHYDSLLSDGLR